MNDIFTCKACGQAGHVFLFQGYCPPCLDELREMVDDSQRARPESDMEELWRQRMLDEESAHSYAEYDLKPEGGC